jgi:hypothetical protein
MRWERINTWRSVSAVRPLQNDSCPASTAARALNAS